MTKQEKIKQRDKKESDVFVYLIGNKIPFAVMISTNHFKGNSYYCAREYHLLAHINDKPKLSKHSFSNNKDVKGVIEKKLSHAEIDSFKKKLELFEKTKHDNSGRIYELKQTPFKDYFKNQKIKE